MARTQLEKDLSKKRINGLILFIDVLLVLYIIAIILMQISPDFKILIEGLLNK